MSEYFYTLDLGAIYGPKLERLAEITSHYDREEFAALLLARAIDHVERNLEAFLGLIPDEEEFEDEHENDADLKGPNSPKGALDIDDGIPL
jgi:2-phospho-L-lactate guanylyltransferase (CobY/MobA/RfbA family)